YLFRFIAQLFAELREHVEPRTGEDKVDIDRGPLPERGEVPYRDAKFWILTDHPPHLAHLVALAEITFKGPRRVSGQRGVPEPAPGKRASLDRCKAHVHAGRTWSAYPPSATDRRQHRFDARNREDLRLDDINHF